MFNLKTAQVALSVGLISCAVLAGCGSKKNSTTDSAIQVVPVTLTKEGCSPSNFTLKPGPTRFDVKNDNAPAVTEFYIYDGDKVLSEVENVVAGVPKTMMYTLEEGNFTVKCLGGTTNEKGTLEVKP